MKPATRPKPAKGRPIEERFYKFAKALMAVPKEELNQVIQRKYRKSLGNQEKKHPDRRRS